MLSEHPMLGKCGVVAIAHYIATYAGLHVLTRGGDVMDAAIAAAFAMTVAYLPTCRAGVDVFTLVWDAKSQ